MRRFLLAFPFIFAACVPTFADDPPPLSISLTAAEVQALTNEMDIAVRACPSMATPAGLQCVGNAFYFVNKVQQAAVPPPPKDDPK